MDEQRTTLRLLPWSSPEGKPCYLSSDSEGGYLSRLADVTEARQLRAGVEALARARQVLGDPMSPYAEVQYTAIRLSECLADVLRVAGSRGLRLPAPPGSQNCSPGWVSPSHTKRGVFRRSPAQCGTPREHDRQGLLSTRLPGRRRKQRLLVSEGVRT